MLSMENGNVREVLFNECLCAYKHRKNKLNLSKKFTMLLWNFRLKIRTVCATLRHGCP